MDNEEQLQSELSNDGNEKIEGNSRVCESESEFHIDNTDRMLKDDCESSMEMDEINQMNVQSDTVKTCMDNCDNHSYADKVSNAEVIMDNKLNLIPTVINDGHEYVIFDEELNVNTRTEVKLLSYRMWGKFGLKHILNNGNGLFVFKFDILQGLNTIIDNGPWIVNNKPMVMQKLDPSVNLDRTEPNTLPLWIKLMNPPLEAWSKKGLSALASRIGSPLIMDAMTTSMCNQGIGRLGYARVLVEVNANKGLEDYIDVMYRNGEQFVKKVRVEYDWKPPMCSHCIVFGHTNSKCPRVVSQSEHVQDKAKDNEDFSNKEKMRQKNKKDDVTVEENLEKNDNHDMLQEINKESLSMKLSKKEKEEVGKITGSSEWIIMGDVNVSLNLEDHSEGMSNFTQDMIDFQECVNEIKMEDINSSGLHFTWIKILLNPNSSFLKKIDRVMDGRRYENCDVAEQFMKHFEGFLGINPTITKLKEEDAYLFGNKITEEEANSPDGFTSKFFKKAWEIIKEELCSAIKEFFRTGILLGEINATLISLVPKSLTPQKVSDFRPIACCNVVYKCISKILTNRIKSALNQIMDENQSAFVPGIAITDNILLTQELLKGYNFINGPKRCSFKIDIQKAYDTVN
ncbi:RNA-directed DNA polymerase, eukaryota, reverse transcriptase zinc-binding domain protein [Tanacetum coccineum]